MSFTTFYGTLICDMSFGTLPSEDSVAMRLTSTSAVKRTIFQDGTTAGEIMLRKAIRDIQGIPFIDGIKQTEAAA